MVDKIKFNNLFKYERAKISFLEVEFSKHEVLDPGVFITVNLSLNRRS